MKKLAKSDTLFETKDVFGMTVRTTRTYWNKIFFIKHKELKVSIKNVVELLAKPDEVHQSIQDAYIFLFYRKHKQQTLVVVVKYINNNGFIVTIYKTSKIKRKGKKLWPKAI